MKKVCGLALVILCVMGVCSLAAADMPGAPKPIAVTAYRQAGWGDQVQIGYVDEEGGLWSLNGYDCDLNWPSAPQDQLAWIAASDQFVRLGTLDFDALFVLNSLVQCVPDQGDTRRGAANDAGVECSYAVRRTADGDEIILLGVSGDELFENVTPDAQALYLFLRESFPNVKNYFGKPNMGPSGFRTVSLMAFCGLDADALAGLRITRTDVDCEASTPQIQLSDEEAAAFLDRVRALRVTGKHSCVVATGGSRLYTLWNAQNQPVATFEFDGEFLVTRDGMYRIQ